MYTDDIKEAFLNYLKSVDKLQEENVKLKYLINIIKEITQKYNANVEDTIIANPIQDCYNIYTLIEKTLKECDNLFKLQEEHND